ncbi:hypothetical protein FBEOM_1747 [Fusarium beomiforme]|uniref:Uncharacterized protein n=1 Tax=Fusarium beomiforme TaxID=44412 RepID=A0A9P5E4R2_9HYPO|nr:hypothetical protein FBEOM_1747 [Fusarium beomiforme]
MSRNRLSAQRRRKTQRAEVAAQATTREADSAQASTAGAATTPSASDAEEELENTKPRPCKHRHIPARKTIDADYKHHVARIRRNGRIQALQAERSADQAKRENASLKQDVEEIREQKNDLRNELMRERGRYRQLLSQENEAAWERLEAEFPL